MLRTLARSPGIYRLANQSSFQPRISPFRPRNFSTNNSRFSTPGSTYRHRICESCKVVVTHRSVLPAVYVGGTRAFHATPQNKQLPLLPVLVGLLKTSTAMEMARTVVRVTLTFIPIVLLKTHKMKRWLAVAEASGEGNPDRKHYVLRKIRYGTILFHALLFAPAALFWLTVMASAERTPLTGRWRLILLSPEEEEEIALQLAGPGWYRAVDDILSKDGTRNLILPNDWRWQWVQDTLRRLESAIPALQREQELGARWLECGPDDIPFPPPAEYPLRPRPRASEYLRRFADASTARPPHRPPHVIPGPPYSLIVVDKPESSNAFSYGFGPDGGGGVVVYSGFLDDVLAKGGSTLTDADQSQLVSPPTSPWWSALFGGIFPSSPSPSSPPPPPHLTPTEEQTSELAILLAHELAHLILSHHLETLSSKSVVWPGVVSIVTDVVRALLFPVTMMFGPFLNDAVAGMGKSASFDLQEMAGFCTSQHQEIEADVVSARLLAHAGFDPRHALRFWEERVNNDQNSECAPGASKPPQQQSKYHMSWMGSAHPLSEVRVSKLREEFERWEQERTKARRQLEMESPSGV